MNAISYSTVRANLAKTMEKVCEDHDPVIITRQREPAVVLLSLEDYEALEQTAYLLRNPANARCLAGAIAQLERGDGQEHQLMQ